jgi:hypothetical protein
MRRGQNRVLESDGVENKIGERREELSKCSKVEDVKATRGLSRDKEQCREGKSRE